MSTGTSKIEVMLELMLIDAHVTLQRDMLLTMRPPAEGQGTRAVIPGGSECDLFVLISRARGLPEVRTPGLQGSQSQSHPPSAFVAAKSSRDIVHGGGVQGATRVVSSSCKPTWCGEPSDLCASGTWSVHTHALIHAQSACDIRIPSS